MYYEHSELHGDRSPTTSSVDLWADLVLNCVAIRSVSIAFSVWLRSAAGRRFSLRTSSKKSASAKRVA